MTSSSKDLKVFGEYPIRCQGCQYHDKELNLENTQIIKSVARGGGAQEFDSSVNPIETRRQFS